MCDLLEVKEVGNIYRPFDKVSNMPLLAPFPFQTLLLKRHIYLYIHPTGISSQKPNLLIQAQHVFW